MVNSIYFAIAVRASSQPQSVAVLREALEISAASFLAAVRSRVNFSRM
jgi:hypothetical protein